MSSLIEIVTLSIVQGVTEFLPISSSAHLILVPLLTGWPDQGIAFDIAVHIGTLIAVCIYFRKDLILLAKGFIRSLLGKPSRYYSRLSWQLIFATIPIAVVGLIAHDVVATTLRSPLVIACSTMAFGALLLISDHYSRHARGIQSFTWRDVLIIGCAQTLALIPGTSRSGITLTAGLSLGFKRSTSATFSFLLSIPVILLAGSYEGYKLVSADTPVNWGPIAVGIAFAAISAYFCIRLFLHLLGKIGVLPFVVYRFILGTFLLLLFI